MFILCDEKKHEKQSIRLPSTASQRGATSVIQTGIMIYFPHNMGYAVSSFSAARKPSHNAIYRLLVLKSNIVSYLAVYSTKMIAP